MKTNLKTDGFRIHGLGREVNAVSPLFETG